MVPNKPLADVASTSAVDQDWGEGRFESGNKLRPGFNLVRGAMTAPSIVVIRKFWRLSWRDRILMLQAVYWLAVAGFVIAVLPFRHVGRLAARRPRGREPPVQTKRIEIKRIRWAMVVAARHVPWTAVCFQQGFAAQLMLRRRGVPSVLYYGATSEEGRLSAHVWVRDGDVDIIGSEIAFRFAVLATFPPQVWLHK
jgi:hypothetical protein